MSNIDGFLAQKYAIQQQQADAARLEAIAKSGYYGQAGAAETLRAQAALQDAATRGTDVAGANQLRTAQARQADVNTNLAVPEAFGRLAQMGAQTGLYGAQADATRTNAALAPLESQARVAGVNAATGQTQAQTAETMANTRWLDQGGGGADALRNYFNAPLTPGVAPTPNSSVFGRAGTAIQNIWNGTRPRGYAAGTSDVRGGKTKVPGKGDGKTDTVHAMLAPGEAVLNKGAAEHLGRDTIDALNHIGQLKMGMGLTPQQIKDMAGDNGVKTGAPDPSASAGYAAGTSSVGGVIAGTPTGTSSATVNARPGVANGLQTWAPVSRGLQTMEAPQTTQMAGYAAGTSKVPAKAGKAAKTPKGKGATINPQMIQALMAMGGQAGMM